jgi:hypothetical protein
MFIMGWFTKKADPISERARALNAEIAALENKIKTLDAQLEQSELHPRLRSTAMPHGLSVPHPSLPMAAIAQSISAPPEPVFEEVDQDQIKTRAETPTTPEHYNELGLRKYDLVALVRRMRNHFRGPAATNPRLINYLAAGSIQGLRPLRYEKRVARNRFIALVIFLLLVLLGIISMFVRSH